jgi:hypothetical protein
MKISTQKKCPWRCDNDIDIEKVKIEKNLFDSITILFKEKDTLGIVKGVFIGLQMLLTSCVG